MERGDVQRGIIRSWAITNFLELGETISSPAPIQVNDEFRDLLLNKESDYVSIYSAGLGLSHYNFLLTDYSFFQFSWFSLNHVRYAYFPNPFTNSSGEEELLEMVQWRDQVRAEL